MKKEPTTSFFAFIIEKVCFMFFFLNVTGTTITLPEEQAFRFSTEEMYQNVIFYDNQVSC